jgi:hypothetical protein
MGSVIQPQFAAIAAGLMEKIRMAHIDAARAAVALVTQNILGKGTRRAIDWHSDPVHSSVF